MMQFLAETYITVASMDSRRNIGDLAWGLTCAFRKSVGFRQADAHCPHWIWMIHLQSSARTDGCLMEAELMAETLGAHVCITFSHSE